MRFSVTVLLRLRPGILDPQGSTIERNLPALGFEGVSSVRVGKAIEMVVDGTGAEEVEERARAMCEQFLANPVIEEFTIEVVARVEDDVPAAADPS